MIRRSLQGFPCPNQYFKYGTCATLWICSTVRLCFFTESHIPTRIIIHHWVVRTVRIHVLSVSTVHVLLHKPPKLRVIEPCPQVIPARGAVIHLPGIGQVVWQIPVFFQKALESIIAVSLPDLMVLIQDEQGAPRLILHKISRISVTSVQEDWIVSPYIADTPVSPVLFRKLSSVEYEPDDLPILLRLIAQPLPVITAIPENKFCSFT